MSPWRREPPPALREGLLRAACCALALALVAGAVDLVLYQRVFRADVLAWAGVGLLAGPLSWLERQAPPQGWRRGVQAFWLACAALVGIWLMGVQTGYSEGFLSHASRSLALEAASEGAWLAAFDPLTLVVLLACALPFVVLPQLRTRHRGPLLLAATNAAVALAVARPLLRLVEAWALRRHVVVVHTSKQLIPTWGLPSGPQASMAWIDTPNFTVGRFLVLMLPLAAAALALSYAAADVLAARWRSHLNEPAPAPPEAGKLPRLPWLCCPLALALGAVLLSLSRAHPNAEQVERWIPLAERGGRGAVATRILERVDASDAELVPTLLRQLGSKQSFRRAWGARLLGRVGPAARDAAEAELLAASTDVDKRVAVEALHALAGIRSRAAIEQLIEISFTGGGGLESQAAEAALETLGFEWDRETLPILLGYADHSGYRVQRRALRLIAELGPEAGDAVDDLLEMIAPSPKPQSQPVRRRYYFPGEVEEALAAIGAPTREALRRRLRLVAPRQIDLQHTQALLMALAKAPPTPEVWELFRLAAERDELLVRQAAVQAVQEQLRKAGAHFPPGLQAEAVALLLQLASDPEHRAQYALGELRSWAVPHLLETLKDPDALAVRPAVLEALGALSRSNRDIDRALVAGARSPDPASRIAAAQALGARFYGEHDALHELAAKDRDASVRREALIAIASRGIERRRARERLRAGLEDPARIVRVEAALLLGGRTWYLSNRDYSYLNPPGQAELALLRPFLPRLIAVLVEALRHPEAVQGGNQVQEILQYLGPHAEPIALRHLVEAVRDEELGEPMRIAAVRTLAAFDSPPARAVRARLAEEVESGTVRRELVNSLR